jgi:hypothetical protein
MTQVKIQKTDASVEEFLNSVTNEKRREDSFAISDLLREVTGEEPSMWGTNIVGFGAYRYKYASGREGEWPVVGFSPRKQNLTLYIMTGFDEYESLLSDLGKHKTGKACLYINKLEDVDQDVLRGLIEQSVNHMKESTS